MAKSYKKVGDYQLEISEPTTKKEIMTYEHIERNVTNLTTELDYWNNLKSEADSLGIVATPEELR